MRQSAQYKDSAWYQLSTPGYKPSYKKLFASAIAGHDAADKLLKVMPTIKLSQQQRIVFTNAATNAQMAFDDFYQPKVNKRESSRDSVMAEMAHLLASGASQRLIIWAHDAHVMRHSATPEDKSNGGGMGAFLERMFPNQYFVLATATATGTFAATTRVLYIAGQPNGGLPPTPTQSRFLGCFAGSRKQSQLLFLYESVGPPGPTAAVAPSGPNRWQ
ncbi:MAG: erythromycin esterase family protein [Hymenobacter sp.]